MIALSWISSSSSGGMFRTTSPDPRSTTWAKMRPVPSSTRKWSARSRPAPVSTFARAFFPEPGSCCGAARRVAGGAAASGTGPVTPDKGAQTPEEYFNSFDLSNPVVAEFTYTDYDGNLIASGQFGRNEDGLYLIQSRGAQDDIDVTALGALIILVTYNNPAGTIPTGPNAGLPYYYIGQTIDYDINILSLFWHSIGDPAGGFGYSGPAELTAEMRYAAFGSEGQIISGDLLPGDPIFYWTGIVNPGYQKINDLFTIVPGTIPGLDVTTARLTAPIFFGIFDIVFFDGIAGIFDPS